MMNKSKFGGGLSPADRTSEFFVLFGLVSLFNGISTFVGYLMPKPFSKKNSSGTIKPIAGMSFLFCLQYLRGDINIAFITSMEIAKGNNLYCVLCLRIILS